MIAALKFLVALAVMVAMVLFAAYNMQPVEVRYSAGAAAGPFPLFYVTLAAGALGAIAAWVLSVLESVRLRLALRKLDKHNSELRTEITSLRKTVAEKERSTTQESLAPAPMPVEISPMRPALAAKQAHVLPPSAAAESGGSGHN